MTRLFLLVALLAQTRIASDFEIAQMEKQLAQSRAFEAQLSSRLNLGDLRASRSELSLARAEYMRAYELASRERVDARKESKLARYANATSYAALAQAKLGREARAFELLEEAMRYASDDAEAWNLYASAMRVLGHPRKAAAAARNAVALAQKPLDVAIYQHALATALIESGESDEARRLLVTITETLHSSKFDALKREAARGEAFEIYSSARGDVAAYVSLLNRAQLRLAALYEQRGDLENARAQYQRVLEGRTDDAAALAGLARLSQSDEERERHYAEAFEANPFSMSLIREYQRYLARVIPSGEPRPPGSLATLGITVRNALLQLSRGETRAARETLDALLAKFPENETLRTLRREAEASKVSLPSPNPTGAELRALLENFERLTPDQRVALDQTSFTSVVVFDSAKAANNQTTFESGTIDGVPFRFSEPTIFAGTFGVNARLTYRILGASADALLLEPLGVQP